MAVAAIRKRPPPDQEPRGCFSPELALGKKRPRKSIHDYEPREKLGEGAFGVVYRATDARTGGDVAVKFVRGGGADGRQAASDVSAVAREAACLRACQGHPSIVRMVDLAADAASGNVYLVMEFVGPSLRERHRGSPLPEEETRAVMRQLLRGAERMHGAGVVHRDIKPENVLVGQGGQVKICDFGLAAAVRPPGTPYPEGRVGTMMYNSPEQLGGNRCYGTAVGMWCVMAELLTGERLFDVYGLEDLLKEVISLRLLFRQHGLRAFNLMGVPELSPAGREVLAGLLAFDPEERLTAEEALQHRWFTEDLSLDLALSL